MKGKSQNKMPKPYNAVGSKTLEEAEDKKDGFKRGGAVRSVEGSKAKARLDRAGRKSGGRSPLSMASKVTNAVGHKATEGDA